MPEQAEKVWQPQLWGWCSINIYFIRSFDRADIRNAVSKASREKTVFWLYQYLVRWLKGQFKSSLEKIYVAEKLVFSCRQKNHKYQIYPICSQRTLSLPPESIRKPDGFFMFSGGRERMYWEQIGYYYVKSRITKAKNHVHRLVSKWVKYCSWTASQTKLCSKATAKSMLWMRPWEIKYVALYLYWWLWAYFLLMHTWCKTTFVSRTIKWGLVFSIDKLSICRVSSGESCLHLEHSSQPHQTSSRK